METEKQKKERDHLWGREPRKGEPTPERDAWREYWDALDHGKGE